jgi:NAD(P)H-dependent FMN reductase
MRRRGQHVADETQLFIPVILGTIRKGRASEHVARFVHAELARFPGVETELVDIRDIPLGWDDEGEALKDSRFSALCDRADGLLLVVPEYNHSFPGSLKRVLDTNLKEYIHKAVGVVGVSAGPWGGARMIQSLLPVLREIGLVTIFWDGNFPTAQKQFDADGNILDAATASRRLEKFFKELIWMSRTLRYGRRNISQD